MDSRESLSHLPAALKLLEEVYERFPVVAAKEALNTAKFLVTISRKRKNEDVHVLDSLLKDTTVSNESQFESNEPKLSLSSAEAVMNQIAPASFGSEEWNWDPNLINVYFDWNFLITGSTPILNSLIPANQV